MIFIVSILSIVMSLVAGAYSIVLLNMLRKKYPSEPINSFFYYQILVFTFGIYGVLGSHLISKILLKFELNVEGIETITLFLPFLGVPFLIAAWFLFIKTALGLVGKNLPQYLAILYFSIATCIFLGYALVMKNLTLNSFITIQNISQIIRVFYYSIEILIAVVVSLIFLVNCSSKINRNERYFLKFFAFTAIGIVVFKAVSLHFAGEYWLARIYFLLIYFGGTLPLIFVLKKHPVMLDKNSISYASGIDQVFKKYFITTREKEIIEEICKGKSNQQIADDLFINLQTVKDHTHSIFKKVNVKNRVQLTRMFSRKV